MGTILLTSYRKPNPMLPFLPGFRDDFNRPDGPLVAASGRPWTFNATSANARADVVVKNNAAVVVVPNGATSNVAALVDARSTNSVLDIVLKAKGNQAGAVAVRSDGINNGIELALRVSAADLRLALFSRVAGQRAQLAVAAAGAPAVHDGSRFSIVTEGINIVVYHDDIPVMTAETEACYGLTKAGVYAYTAGPDIAYDDIRCYA